jgi:hypothetical protein
MRTQTDPGTKADAAIQVQVCGNDAQRRHFEEISTAIPTPSGALLETTQELCEGTTLEITRPSTRHKAIAKVKSLGPKLGVSTLVFVEGLGVENLWNKDSLAENGAGREDAASSDPPFGDGIVDALVAQPERGLPPSSLRIPSVDRLMESLTDLVQSALEENLRPTVERLASEIPEQVVQARAIVFSNFEEQLETAFASFNERLDSRAQHVERELAERLVRQADEIAERFCAQLQESLQHKLADQETKFLEQWAASADQLRTRLLEQVEGELNKRKEKTVRETQHSLNDARQQDQTRIVQLLRAWADAVENQAVAAPERAAA